VLLVDVAAAAAAGVQGRTKLRKRGGGEGGREGGRVSEWGHRRGRDERTVLLINVAAAAAAGVQGRAELKGDREGGRENESVDQLRESIQVFLFPSLPPSLPQAPDIQTDTQNAANPSINGVSCTGQHRPTQGTHPPSLPPSLPPYLRRRAHKQTGKTTQALQGPAFPV